MRAAYADLQAANSAWQAAKASATKDTASWNAAIEVYTDLQKAHWQYDAQYAFIKEELGAWLEERPELQERLREMAGPSGIAYFTEKMAQVAEANIAFDARRNMLKEKRDTQNTAPADCVYAKPHNVNNAGYWTDMVDMQRNGFSPVSRTNIKGQVRQ